MMLGGGSFEYDPANGSLLLDIQVSGGDSSPSQFLDARSGDAAGIFSRATNGATGGLIGWGLVTRFDTAPVPEPSSLLLLYITIAGTA
jgi:hypothetical protein